MVCGQCGAGLTPDMFDAGACEYCGTAIADVAPKKHVEKVVNARVEAVKDELERELKRDLQRDLRRDLARDRKAEAPSVVVVAAKEAGRYTAMRAWGCGAGCLSTVGSLLFTLLIGGVVVFAQMAPHMDWSKLPFGGGKNDTHKPSPHPKKGRGR